MIENLVSVQRWLYQGLASGMKGAGGPDSLLALLALAFVFGAIHAFMPGHGKTVLMSYHLGRAGRVAEGLAGIAVIRRTLGPSRSADAVEIASSILITAVGLWLVWRAARPHRHDQASGPMLAVVTGLVPCPLTTFIMSYAVLNDQTALGVVVAGAMAIGMVTTIGAFAIAAVLARARLVRFLDRSESWRGWAVRGLEFFSAGAVVALGTWALVQRSF